MAEVVFRTPGEMNLLGYLLRAVIQRNLATEPGARVIRKLKGRILLTASRMQVTLAFENGTLTMAVGQDGKIDARVQGSMDTLLGVALGKGMVGAVLGGRLKVGGKVWKLLPMLKLLKTPEAAA